MEFLSSTPDSLTGWRDFMVYKLDRPAVLLASERSALTLAQRENYDDARITFINARMVLPTPDIDKLIREERIVTGLSRGHQFTARQALAVSGRQTMGKSTAALHLGRRHEVRMRAKSGRQTDNQYTPVVYRTTPPQTTPKGLMTRFANTLGLPLSQRLTTGRQMDVVVNVLRLLETSMVILDEIQLLRTRAKAGLEAASALKGFSERIPATFLYVGVILFQSNFLRGAMGAQMQDAPHS